MKGANKRARAERDTTTVIVVSVFVLTCLFFMCFPEAGRMLIDFFGL
jgi:hypothetical protein